MQSSHLLKFSELDPPLIGFFNTGQHNVTFSITYCNVPGLGILLKFNK